MSIGTEWAVPWMRKLIHITTVKTLKIIQRYHCSTNAIVINAWAITQSTVVKASIQGWLASEYLRSKARITVQTTQTAATIISWGIERRRALRLSCAEAPLFRHCHSPTNCIGR